MTQEIKTDKFEGLLVKVPEGSHDHKIIWSDTDDRFFIDYEFSENHRGGFIMWYKDFGTKKKYPKKGSLKLIGNPFELSEEECKCIVKKHYGFTQSYYEDYHNKFSECLLAKQSFNSLLKSLQVYKENPYGDYSQAIIDKVSYHEWEQAEIKSGNWVLIQKIG